METRKNIEKLLSFNGKIIANREKVGILEQIVKDFKKVQEKFNFAQ